MKMYTGRSADGSDITEFEGFYTSSCGNYYGSEPFSKHQEKELRKINTKKKINNYMKPKKIKSC